MDLRALSAVNILENLQYHKSDLVYENVSKILQTYFEIQDPLDLWSLLCLFTQLNLVSPVILALFLHSTRQYTSQRIQNKHHCLITAFFAASSASRFLRRSYCSFLEVNTNYCSCRSKRLYCAPKFSGANLAGAALSSSVAFRTHPDIFISCFGYSTFFLAPNHPSFLLPFSMIPPPLSCIFLSISSSLSCWADFSRVLYSALIFELVNWRLVWAIGMLGVKLALTSTAGFLLKLRVGSLTLTLLLSNGANFKPFFYSICGFLFSSASFFAF